MLDLALLSANAAQLKFVLMNWDHLNFRELLLALVIASIFLQVNLMKEHIKSLNLITMSMLFADFSGSGMCCAGSCI